MILFFKFITMINCLHIYRMAFLFSILIIYGCNFKPSDSPKENIAKMNSYYDTIPQITGQFYTFEENSNGYCIVKGNTTEKKIGLTFNAAPSELTNRILDVLEKHNTKATFFWQGNNVASNIKTIKRAKKKHHLIANHSWDHSNGQNVDKNEVWVEQISKTIKEFKEVVNITPTYFRPPFGRITQEQINYYAEKGITTVLWSVTTLDWGATQNSSQEMFNRFKDYLHNGAVILIHDVDYESTEDLLTALDKMITYGKYLGYEFVTIDTFDTKIKG